MDVYEPTVIAVELFEDFFKEDVQSLVGHVYVSVDLVFGKYSSASSLSYDLFD